MMAFRLPKPDPTMPEVKGVCSLVPRPFAPEGRVWTRCNKRVVQVECNNLFGEKKHMLHDIRNN